MNSTQIISALKEIYNYKVDLNNVFTTLSTIYSQQQEIIKKPSTWIEYADTYEYLMNTLSGKGGISSQDFYYCESTTNTTWTGNKLKYNYTDCRWQKTGLLSTFQINNNLIILTITGSRNFRSMQRASALNFNGAYKVFLDNERNIFKYEPCVYTNIEVQGLDEPIIRNYNFNQNINPIRIAGLSTIFKQYKTYYKTYFDQHSELTGMYAMQTGFGDTDAEDIKYVTFNKSNIYEGGWGYLSSVNGVDTFIEDKNVKVTNNISSFVGHIFNTNMSKEISIGSAYFAIDELNFMKLTSQQRRQSLLLSKFLSTTYNTNLVFIGDPVGFGFYLNENFNNKTLNNVWKRLVPIMNYPMYAENASGYIQYISSLVNGETSVSTKIWNEMNGYITKQIESFKYKDGIQIPKLIDSNIYHREGTKLVIKQLPLIFTTDNLKTLKINVGAPGCNIDIPFSSIINYNLSALLYSDVSSLYQNFDFNIKSKPLYNNGSFVYSTDTSKVLSGIEMITDRITGYITDNLIDQISVVLSGNNKLKLSDERNILYPLSCGLELIIKPNDIYLSSSISGKTLDNPLIIDLQNQSTNLLDFTINARPSYKLKSENLIQWQVLSGLTDKFITTKSGDYNQNFRISGDASAFPTSSTNIILSSYYNGLKSNTTNNILTATVLISKPIEDKSINVSSTIYVNNYHRYYIDTEYISAKTIDFTFKFTKSDIPTSAKFKYEISNLPELITTSAYGDNNEYLNFYCQNGKLTTDIFDIFNDGFNNTGRCIEIKAVVQNKYKEVSAYILDQNLNVSSDQQFDENINNPIGLYKLVNGFPYITSSATDTYLSEIKFSDNYFNAPTKISQHYTTYISNYSQYTWWQINTVLKGSVDPTAWLNQNIYGRNSQINNRYRGQTGYYGGTIISASIIPIK